MSASDKTSNAGSWKSLLTSIASFRGDLSTLTAPPFILSPTSQLEYTRYWYPGKEIFEAPALEQDEVKRLLLVVKYTVACMRASYTQRNVTEGYEKKPLNPFLGELFAGKYVDSGAELLAEQVSHHPPASAFAINSKNGISVEGSVGVKARFSTTICVEQNGHTVYKIDNGALNETYAIGLPKLHVEGFLSGKPYLELDGSYNIVSSTGYTANLAFSGAGYLSGHKHTAKITVFKSTEPKKILYTIKGQWHKKLTIKNEATGESSEFSDLSSVEDIPELAVAPEEKQFSMESRKAWSKVAEAIRSGSNDTISKEKSKLENLQRELRKQEQAEGKEWERRWFKLVDADEPAKWVESDAQIYRFQPEQFKNDPDFKGQVQL